MHLARLDVTSLKLTLFVSVLCMCFLPGTIITSQLIEYSLQSASNTPICLCLLPPRLFSFSCLFHPLPSCSHLRHLALRPLRNVLYHSFTLGKCFKSFLQSSASVERACVHITVTALSYSNPHGFGAADRLIRCDVCLCCCCCPQATVAHALHHRQKSSYPAASFVLLTAHPAVSRRSGFSPRLSSSNDRTCTHCLRDLHSFQLVLRGLPPLPKCAGET